MADHKICKVPDCGRDHSAHGLCVYHRQRELAHGDPVTGGKRKRNLLPSRHCSVEGCDRTHFSNNFCAKHHQRWFQAQRRANRPTKITSVRRLSSGWLSKSGYRYLVVAPNTPGAHCNQASGQWTIFEHRFVMQGIIGRPLLRRETVHHINGVRSDNRPENLELWAQSHGPGQRTKDMVTWAEEVLARYGHLSEATFGRTKNGR